MKTDKLGNRFDEMTENQIKVAAFLKAFDPILDPFESMAKHGISLSISFVGVSATFITVFKPSISSGTIGQFLLFSTWVFFMSAIATGSLQLWRIMSFREQMRKFSYVLLGEKPSVRDQEDALRIIQQSYKSAITLEYIFLFLGTVMFIVWAICQINGS